MHYDMHGFRGESQRVVVLVVQGETWWLDSGSLRLLPIDTYKKAFSPACSEWWESFLVYTPYMQRIEI